jgi:aryl-alcohol dehydrogenase-like predicted oxidoreductase
MAKTPQQITRRQFIETSTAAGVGVLSGPLLAASANKPSKTSPISRSFGRTGFQVTTMGLGGQASLQWTPQNVDPVEIIMQAYSNGINYFDTSNVYDGSQLNYGKAFRRIGLTPGHGNYEEAMRRRVFVASKTMLRMATGRMPAGPRVEGSQGPRNSHAIDDLKRTLSQLFGDGKGAYPDDAYVDLFQIHNLNYLEEVDAIYMGVKDTDRSARQIGALAALRDYRDGTNLTGLNPHEERRIRHIGITGHFSSPVLIECIQRDDEGLLDTLLIAINANDRLYFNNQFNVIPVAREKGMGIIAMKLFADGAMFGRKAGWNHLDPQVIQTVGSSSIQSAPLVQYALSIPGISTAIMGIGKIDSDKTRCQLQQNLSAAQLGAPLNQNELQAIEQVAGSVLEGRTNYFQMAAEPLSAPQRPTIQQDTQDGKRVIQVAWQTAYAADAPIAYYGVQRDGREIGKVQHRPQLTKAPFQFEDVLDDHSDHSYTITTVDTKNRRAETDELKVS